MALNTSYTVEGRARYLTYVELGDARRTRGDLQKADDRGDVEAIRVMLAQVVEAESIRMLSLGNALEAVPTGLTPKFLGMRGSSEDGGLE